MSALILMRPRRCAQQPVDTSSAGVLVGAIRDTAAADPAFAAHVTASVERVLTLKQQLGLVCR